MKWNKLGFFYLCELEKCGASESPCVLLIAFQDKQNYQPQEIEIII